MKQYWANAIIYTSDGPDRLFTYNAAHSFDAAEKQFDIWQNHYGYKIASRWIDIIGDDNSKEKSSTRVNLDVVKELWKQFGDVPMDPETECIEKRWGSALWVDAFRPGTHREEIWKWFEETFDVSVAEDLMGMEG